MGGHFTAEESQPKNLLLWSLLNGESDSKRIHTDQNFWTEAVQDEKVFFGLGFYAEHDILSQ